MSMSRTAETVVEDRKGTESGSERSPDRRPTAGDQAGFERLVADLSAIFISSPSERIDAEIEVALRGFGELFGLDRCAVDQFSPDKTELRVTHLWAAEGIDPDPWAREASLSSELPWYTRRMLSGKPLIFTSRDEIPTEAVAERRNVEGMDIGSSAIFPLVVGGDVVGNFAVDTIGRQRRWTDEFLERMQVIGRIIGSALARQRLEAEIDERSRFEGLVTEISAAFAAARAEDLDRVIDDSLRRLGELLRLGVTHAWSRAGGEAGIRGTVIDETFPWLTGEFRRGRPLCVSRSADWPAEAETEKAHCESLWRRRRRSCRCVSHVILGALQAARSSGTKHPE